MLHRYAEKWQTAVGVKKVKTWASTSNQLGLDDIFISGNVDEIMSRGSLQKLKWCQTSADLLSGALWMPLGNLNWALRTGFPVKDRPHTFSLPTIYKWKDIRSGKHIGKRLLVDFPEMPVEKYISGGIHLTNPAFMPQALLKELTATEDNFYGGYINSAYLLSLTLEDINAEQQRYFQLDGKDCWRKSVDNAKDAPDVVQYLPWFLSCNLDRYPYWLGQLDPRNLDLYQSLEKLKQSIRTVKQIYWEKNNVSKLFSRTLYPTKKNNVMGCVGEIHF